MTRAAILAIGTALATATVAIAAPAFSADTAAKAAPAVKAAAASKSSYKAPRLAFGQPDLQGYWSNATLTPMVRPSSFGTRGVYTPEEVKKLEKGVQEEVAEGNKPTDPNAPAEAPKVDPAKIRPEFAAAGGDVGGYNRGWLDPGASVMRVGGEPRTSLITTANGQPPPRKAGGDAGGFRRGGGMGSFDNAENRSLGERCIIGFGRNGGPPMFPNGFYNNDYNIVQTPDTVAIQVEMNHDVRIIRLNATHRTDDTRPYFGDSIGHWEGDTLVVETTNLPQSQNFMGSWKKLKVTERFTRVAKDRLRYAFTVEDPDTWDKPWGGEYEFGPMPGIIYEYACHEGNYALPGMLGGARRQEKEAAAAKSTATSGGE
ncbi:MAG: hypothetical protein ACJ798_14835 [Phenylobacterium sp.]